MIATSARALITSQINSATSRLHSIDQSLAVTRKVLIKNLVEAFDLREAIPPTTPTGTGGGDNYMLPFAVNSASFIDAGRALFGRGMGMSAIAGGLGQSLLGDKKPVVPGKGEWSIAGLVLPVPGDVRREQSLDKRSSRCHANFSCQATLTIMSRPPFPIRSTSCVFSPFTLG